MLGLRRLREFKEITTELGELNPLGVCKVDNSIYPPVVTVRAVTEQDTSAYHRVLSNPAVVKYDDFDIISYKTAVSDIKLALQGYDSGFGEGCECTLAIDYDTRDVPCSAKTVGFLYFTMSSCGGQPAYMIGYHLDPEYQGKGIARKAVRMLVGKITVIANRTAFALVYEGNSRSIKLLENCGFILDSGYRAVRNVRGKAMVELRYTLTPPQFRHALRSMADEYSNNSNNKENKS